MKKIMLICLMLFLSISVCYAGKGDIVQIPVIEGLNYPLTLAGQSQMLRDLHSLPPLPEWSDSDKAIDAKWRNDIQRTAHITSGFGEKHPEFKPYNPYTYSYKVDEIRDYSFYVYANPALRPNKENYGATVINVPKIESDVLFEKNVYDYNIYSNQLYWGYTEIYRKDGSISHVDRNINKNIVPGSILEKAILISLILQSGLGG